MTALGRYAALSQSRIADTRPTRQMEPQRREGIDEALCRRYRDRTMPEAVGMIGIKRGASLPYRRLRS
jgi:hypothetical protein